MTDSSYNGSHTRCANPLSLISPIAVCSDDERLKWVENDCASTAFWHPQDVEWMQSALAQAKLGGKTGEVPVGAVLVYDNQIIGQGFNQPITQSDPTCHAEIVALRSACHGLQNYRLPTNTTLYVTLEPCTMCLGALIHARLSRIVYATSEPRAGMLGSQLDLTAFDFYNHKIKVSSGLYAKQSRQLLQGFFKQRRRNKRQKI